MDSEWHGAKWWRRRDPEERLENAGIPKRYAQARLDDFSGLNRKLVNKYIADHAVNEGMGLVLMGDRAAHMAAALITDRLLNAKFLCARFEAASAIVQMAYDTLEEGGGMLPSPPYESPWLYRLLREWDLLVINGLGEEANTEYTTRCIASLIKDRYDEMKSTIVVTDMTVEHLSERYGRGVWRALTDTKTFWWCTEVND